VTALPAAAQDRHVLLPVAELERILATEPMRIVRAEITRPKAEGDIVGQRGVYAAGSGREVACARSALDTRRSGTSSCKRRTHSALRMRPAQRLPRLICALPPSNQNGLPLHPIADAIWEQAMGGSQELKGPDLSAGIDASGLKDNEPFLGHAEGEAIVLVRRG